MPQRARFPVEVTRPGVRCGRRFHTPPTLWRGSLIFLLTESANVGYDYSCQRGKPTETAETYGMRSEDAQQRASDICCESWCRGGTAGQRLLTRTTKADTIEAQKKKRRMAQFGGAPALGAGGRRFKSCYADSANLVTGVDVAGSSPATGPAKAGVA